MCMQVEQVQLNHRHDCIECYIIVEGTNSEI